MLLFGGTLRQGPEQTLIIRLVPCLTGKLVGALKVVPENLWNVLGLLDPAA